MGRTLWKGSMTEPYDERDTPWWRQSLWILGQNSDFIVWILDLRIPRFTHSSRQFKPERKDSREFAQTLESRASAQKNLINLLRNSLRNSLCNSLCDSFCGSLCNSLIVLTWMSHLGASCSNDSSKIDYSCFPNSSRNKTQFIRSVLHLFSSPAV